MVSFYASLGFLASLANAPTTVASNAEPTAPNSSSLRGSLGGSVGIVPASIARPETTHRRLPHFIVWVDHHYDFGGSDIGAMSCSGAGSMSLRTSPASPAPPDPALPGDRIVPHYDWPAETRARWDDSCVGQVEVTCAADGEDECPYQSLMLEDIEFLTDCDGDLLLRPRRSAGSLERSEDAALAFAAVLQRDQTDLAYTYDEAGDGSPTTNVEILQLRVDVPDSSECGES